MMEINTLSVLYNNFEEWASDNACHQIICKLNEYEVAYGGDNLNSVFCNEHNIMYYDFKLDKPVVVIGPYDISLVWIIPNKKKKFELYDITRDVKTFLSDYGVDADTEKDVGHIFVGDYAITNHFEFNIAPKFTTSFGACHIIMKANQEYFIHTRNTPPEYNIKGLLDIAPNISTENVSTFIGGLIDKYMGGQE